MLAKKKAASPGLGAYDDLANGLHSDSLNKDDDSGFYHTRRTFGGELSEFQYRNNRISMLKSYGAALRRYFLAFLRGELLNVNE